MFRNVNCLDNNEILRGKESEVVIWISSGSNYKIQSLLLTSYLAWSKHFEQVKWLKFVSSLFWNTLFVSTAVSMPSMKRSLSKISTHRTTRGSMLRNDIFFKTMSFVQLQEWAIVSATPVFRLWPAPPYNWKGKNLKLSFPPCFLLAFLFSFAYFLRSWAEATCFHYNIWKLFQARLFVWLFVFTEIPCLDILRHCLFSRKFQDRAVWQMHLATFQPTSRCFSFWNSFYFWYQTYKNFQLGSWHFVHLGRSRIVYFCQKLSDRIRRWNQYS